MKSILLPTDFSDNSLNSLRYGMEIARITKAEVIFFHANHIPVIAPNTPVGVYDQLIHEDEEKQKKSLQNLQENIYREMELSQNEVPSKCVIRLGFAVDEITAAANEFNVGLIVMGTHGASGLKKALIGSNTASVIKKYIHPVLAVPHSANFKGLNKIGFATDFHHTEDDKALAPLLELSYLSDSKVMIFNIRKSTENVPSFEEAEEGLKIETVFKKVNHSYHFSEKEDVVEGIEEFVKKENIDMLAMMPHKPSFWENWFGKSYTEEIAFHATIPLLTLPEKL